MMNIYFSNRPRKLKDMTEKRGNGRGNKEYMFKLKSNGTSGTQEVTTKLYKYNERTSQFEEDTENKLKCKIKYVAKKCGKKPDGYWKISSHKGTRYCTEQDLFDILKVGKMRSFVLEVEISELACTKHDEIPEWRINRAEQGTSTSTTKCMSEVGKLNENLLEALSIVRESQTIIPKGQASNRPVPKRTNGKALRKVDSF